VKVAQRTVAVVLSEEGRAAMELAAASVPGSPVLFFFVQDTDDMGLWVRVKREDGDHLVLVRWEFVLSLDFPMGETKTIGIRS